MLLILTLATLLVSASETRLLDDSFVLDHLQRAGVFRRAAATAVPAEARRRLQEAYPGTAPEVADEVAVWATRLLTPEWLARCTEAFLRAGMHYLADERSSLDVVLPVADRVVAIRGVLADRIDESPLAEVAYERLIEAAALRFASLQSDLPFGITTAAATWDRALRVGMDPVWLANTLEGAVGSTTAWLVGETDELSVHLPLREQRDRIAEAIETVVNESDIDVYFREQVIRPALVGQLEERTVVPDTSVVFLREELVRTLESLTDLDWAREQRALVVGVLVDYLTGRRDDLGMTVDLRPLGVQAAERLTALVQGRIDEWVATRPVCGKGDTARMFVGTLSPLHCRATGAPQAAMKFLVSAFVRDQVARAVNDNMPTAWNLDEPTLRENLSDDAWELLRKARGWMETGLTLDARDIAGLLEGGAVDDGMDLLMRLRTVTREGFRVGLADLGSAEAVTEPLDWARTALVWLDRARAPVAIAMGLCVLVLLSANAVPRRTRVRLLGGALVLAAVGSIVLTRLAESAAEPLLRKALEVPNATALVAALLRTLPRAAASMLGEIARAAELAANGILLLGALLFGLSLVIRNRPALSAPTDT